MTLIRLLQHSMTPARRTGSKPHSIPCRQDAHVQTTHVHVVVVRNLRIVMVAISVNNLIKKFGDKTAVSIPDFCFPPNEIIGLVGNNGAGKTTLFRLIFKSYKIR